MKKLKTILAFPLEIIIIPVVAFSVAIAYAIDENSVKELFSNFWKCFSRLTKRAYYRICGFKSAGFYRLHHEGGCGPWVWHKKKPRNPKGKKWIIGSGLYS